VVTLDEFVDRVMGDTIVRTNLNDTNAVWLGLGQLVKKFVDAPFLGLIESSVIGNEERVIRSAKPKPKLLEVWSKRLFEKYDHVVVPIGEQYYHIKHSFQHRLYGFFYFCRMYQLIKRILFLWPAEKAHHLTMQMLVALNKLGLVGVLFGTKSNKDSSVKLWNLTFKNKVGLAAGFDKNAEFMEVMDALGFGFVEVGTVTPKAQDGNPKPRLFRLPQDEGLINRMGFNNKGLDYMVEQLKTFRAKHPRTKMRIGGNIGKNKVTPNEQATQDYIQSFRALHPYVDFFVVNVSSPNTPNLRELQEVEPLRELLSGLIEEEKTMEVKHKPILLKIAPDVHEDLLAQIVKLVSELNLEGMVLTNTTISREGLKTSANEVKEIGAGGLSGAPVRELSYDVLKKVHALNPELPIISVGGIMSGQEGLKRLEGGASLVQIYSGLIFKGPSLIRQLVKL
jgi:dihydroorotate dehydrogenase